MRVLVCGGRDYADKDEVWRVLDGVAQVRDENSLGENIVLIHGACPTGADLWASGWAAANWQTEKRYPANWERDGRAAGPIRNQRMLDEGKPDLVVAFPGGRGTEDMKRRSRLAGIKVIEVG